MKTLPLHFAFIVAFVSAFSVMALEPDPLVNSCCQVSSDSSGSAKGGCCSTKDASEDFTKSCCKSEVSKNGEDARADGQRGGRRGGGMRGGGMQSAHTLIANHASITREVNEVPSGVRTITTTTNSELVAVLQSHPAEMAERLEGGGHVRPWDPLFRELAEHADEVEMQYTKLENGIEVISTSTNPEVVKLIRAHAYKVSEFVARGRAAMHEASPLPDDYDTDK